MVQEAVKHVGIGIRWEGEGVNEFGIVDDLSGFGLETTTLKVGDVIVRVDPAYYRPTEVETLLGDPAKAREKLGWTPQTSFQELVREMMNSDLKEAHRDELLRRNGFEVFTHHE